VNGCRLRKLPVVHLSYVNLAGDATTGSDLRTASYDGSSWTSKTSLFTSTISIMGTSIGININTKEIYVTYLRGTVNALNNAYYKVSSDGMTTWSVERGPLTADTADHKAIGMNLSSTDMFGVYIFNDDLNDMFYGNLYNEFSVPGAVLLTNMLGFEDGGLQGSNNRTGTYSASTAMPRSGEYSLKLNSVGSTSWVQYLVAAAATGSQSTVDTDNMSAAFAINVTSLPSVDTLIWSANETTTVMQITLNTSGTLTINGTGSTTSTFALSTNTWYIIVFSYNSDTDLVELGIYDNEMEVQHDYLTSTITNLEDLDNVRFGPQTTSTSEMYFDDMLFYINNEAANFPIVAYDYSITRMDLDSTGTDTAWTNTYTSIDEIPPSSTDYIETNAIADETSGLESSTAAGIYGSIPMVKFLNTLWEAVTQTSSVRAIRTRSPGIIETTVVDPGTTINTHFAMYPTNSGSSNAIWTTGFLDSLEVGIGNDTVVTNMVRNGTTVVEVMYIENINVTGNIYNAGTSTALTECDASTTTYELRLYTKGNYYWASCSNSDGSFTFSNVEKPDTGDSMVFWIDDAFASETDGALVVRYDGTGDSTSNIFYDDTVTITSDDTNPVTNAIMDVYDGNSDSDIPYTVTSNNLTVNSGYELLIKIKSGVANGSIVYDPGGTITTNATGGDMHVIANGVAYIDTATSSIGRDLEVESGSILYIDGSTNVLGGDILTTTTGYVTYSTGTPTVTLSGTGTIGGGSTALTFYNLSLDSTGTSTVATNVNINNNLVVGDGSNARTLDMNTNDKNLDVNGNVTIAASGTVLLSNTGNTNFGGSFTNSVSGVLTHNNSTVTFDKASGTSTINTGGDSFYNIIFNDGGGGATYLLASNLDTDNNLTITSGSLDVDTTSNYSITLGNDWLNNGTFLERAGSVTFDGTSSGIIDSGCTNVTTCTTKNFYNLIINKSSTAPSVTVTNDDALISNTLTVTTGIFDNALRTVRMEGTTSVSIATNGIWRDISTGDIVLGGSLINNGTLTFKANNTCGGTDDIAITAVSGTPSWSGSGSFELRDVNMSNQNAAVPITLFSSTNTTGNTGSWTFNSGCVGGSLVTDIVDAGGSPVASPTVALTTAPFGFNYQTSTGTFGVSSQKIRVTNSTGTAPWTLSVAAASGPSSFWNGASSDYDYNDPTASAVDGVDTDSLGGQLSVNPSVGTITPEVGCTSTGISMGSSSSFSEPGSVNSITVVSASGSADVDCYWDITGVGVSQTIPAEQTPIDYSIDMVVSVIAS